MNQKLSYAELLRLIHEARDLIIAQGESIDFVVSTRQHGWLRVANDILVDFDPNRPIKPDEVLKAAVSHMTPAELEDISEQAYQIVRRADRDFARYKRNQESI